MKVGSLIISGPQAWPDHLLDVNHRALAGFAIAIRRTALGFECAGLRYAYVYLVYWCFEFSWDHDRSWGRGRRGL